MLMWALCWLQGSADSNYSQPSSDLSLDEEKETLRREKERQALNQLEKARVSWVIEVVLTSTDNLVPVSAGVKRQAGQGGSTAHVAPTFLFQKHCLITRRTSQFRLRNGTKCSVRNFFQMASNITHKI